MAKRKAGNSKDAVQQRRKLFIEAYCGEHRLNGKQSAIAAGFAPKSAEVTACRLLRQAKVKAAIAKRMAKAQRLASDVTDLTAVEVMRDLAEAMRFDPAALYDDEGNLLPVKKMPLEVRKHLEGTETDVVKIGEKGFLVTSKVKFAKKTATREQAMKHFGLFEKDNRQRPPLPPIKIEFV